MDIENGESYQIMTNSKHIYKKITFTSRVELERLLKNRHSFRVIEELGLMSRTSIAREKSRCKGEYNAIEAQKDVDAKAEIKKFPMFKTRSELFLKLMELENRILMLECSR
jgi:IS30 family transposase